MNYPNIPRSSRLVKTKKVVYKNDWKTRVVTGVQYIKPVYVVSSTFQVLFGTSMVGVALLGFITPIWIAALVNVFGCVVAVTGAYQLYDIFRNDTGTTSLVNDAVRHAVDFRN
ncbi:MAG: hypothetical protein LAT57_01530 [Balneolales bacterium]|nr:hypothetical protein [Balneolales bacterium]